jgi:hypothetical protein
VLTEVLGEDRIVAIATLVQNDISALCVASSSSTFTAANRPGKLAGARYGSCGYPLERAAINAMILKDGGSAGVVEVCPQLRTQTEMNLIEGHVDCAWLYRPWEVLRARRQGVTMHEMVPAEWGVPFGYMNNLIALRSRVTRELADGTTGVLVRFLKALVRGGASVTEDPRDAAGLLAEGAECYGPDLADEQFNHESILKLIALGAFAPCADSFDAGQGHAAAVDPAVSSKAGADADGMERPSASTRTSTNANSDRRSEACSCWALMNRKRWAAFLDWAASILELAASNPSTPCNPANTSTPSDTPDPLGAASVSAPDTGDAPTTTATASHMGSRADGGAAQTQSTNSDVSRVDEVAGRDRSQGLGLVCDVFKSGVVLPPPERFFDNRLLLLLLLTRNPTIARGGAGGGDGKGEGEGLIALVRPEVGGGGGRVQSFPPFPTTTCTLAGEEAMVGGGGAGWVSLGVKGGERRGGGGEHVKGCRCCFPPDQMFEDACGRIVGLGLSGIGLMQV